MLYLSACSIVKDETPFLAEWVEFHRLVGMEHFTIYDNESRVPVSETLARQVASGFVTVEPVRGRGKQMEVYRLHAERNRHLSEWTAFLDADEFVIPHESDDIRDILTDIGRTHYGLAINWQVFGTSGYLDTPPTRGAVPGL